jgi:tRNA nucleotidyltransferase (CCA-adding enzyme)
MVVSDNYIVSVDALQLATTIAHAVRDRGGRVFVVGGFVRDRLLGRPSDEIDVEVFGIAEPHLKALLERIGRVEPVGQQFAVYKMGSVDVALPRRESKTGRGHKAFAVTGRSPPRFHDQRHFLGPVDR